MCLVLLGELYAPHVLLPELQKTVLACGDDEVRLGYHNLKAGGERRGKEKADRGYRETERKKERERERERESPAEIPTRHFAGMLV